jgi:uncharacterized protein (DUF305 family)
MIAGWAAGWPWWLIGRERLEGAVSGGAVIPFRCDTVYRLKMPELTRTPKQNHPETRRPLQTIKASAQLCCVWLAAVGLCGAGGRAAAQQTGAATVVQPGAPGTPSKTLPASTTGVLPQNSHDDVEFMQGMIMHHAQAVAMTALIPSRTQNAKIRRLGERISLSQSDEMKFMKRWLAARGQSESMAMAGMDMHGGTMNAMPGMLTPPQMVALRHASGAQFDHLFLTGMIQHHNGALIMVKDLFGHAGAGQDAELFDFATDADNSQRAEIRIMQNMLKEKQ